MDRFPNANFVIKIMEESHTGAEKNIIMNMNKNELFRMIRRNILK